LVVHCRLGFPTGHCAGQNSTFICERNLHFFIPQGKNSKRNQQP
jgi:hypothetical protein